MKKYNRLLAALGLSIILTLLPLKASYASDVSNAGYIAGSGFSSLLYTPIKGAYALLMGVTGGLSLMATIPANKPSISLDLVNIGIGGDWWVSPNHLRGKVPLKFNGSTR